MNLSDYWQENKKLVSFVLGGVVLFFVAFLWLNSSLGAQDRSSLRKLAELKSDLAAPLYVQADRKAAQDDNTGLNQALSALAGRAVFETREEFRLKPGEGSPSNVYFQRVDQVREGLARIASRSRASLPDELGLEPLMTNDVETITRHLAALDLIDRCVRQALASGLTSIDRLAVHLDPAFQSKQGVGAIERTRIDFEARGDSEAMTAFLVATQGDEYGRPAVIDNLELRTDRRDPELVLCSMQVSALWMHQPRGAKELE
ncbi:MAG: hypothetical protein R3F33_12655 [Planctomycetota bacterium]